MELLLALTIGYQQVNLSVLTYNKVNPPVEKPAEPIHRGGGRR
jgi:hypothetical protein